MKESAGRSDRCLQRQKVGKKNETTSNESFWSLLREIFLPFLVAGFGMVGAGCLLDKVRHRIVFQQIPEIFILVPALLGLKGNLEMTLAARLSTSANLGLLQTREQKLKIAWGNIALTQVQAIAVGFLASFAALFLGSPSTIMFPWQLETTQVQNALLLCASAMLTAAAASFILGVLMVGVVFCSREIGVDPDNVATPLAAALGDLTTLALLTAFTSFFWNIMNQWPLLAPSAILFLLLFIAPFCVISCRSNPSVSHVLTSGWTPVIVAMAISSLGGVILNVVVRQFPLASAFQPVINGIGGNLVAVFASRISTRLHRQRKEEKDGDGDKVGATDRDRKGITQEELDDESTRPEMNDKEYYDKVLQTRVRKDQNKDQNTYQDEDQNKGNSTPDDYEFGTKATQKDQDAGALTHAKEYEKRSGKIELSPSSTFLGSGSDATSARVLVSLVIPGHLAFSLAIRFLQSNSDGNTIGEEGEGGGGGLKAEDESLSMGFYIAYLTAAFIQVVLLLTLARWLVGLLWRRGQDPDNCAIPYLTGIGDLLGTGLLAMACVIVDYLG